jgi:hypothetical protein
MKRLVVLLLFAPVLMFANNAAAQDKPWFDTQNCAFCKLFAAEPGLLDHMASEYHNIPDGIVSLTHIDTGYEGAFKHAQAGIGPILQEIQKTGKVPYMCPHCQKLGEFTMKGVKQEQVVTNYGIVAIYQSGDSAMVAQLQDFGARAAEELAKRQAERKASQEPKK